jgi:hypothetical protein
VFELADGEVGAILAKVAAEYRRLTAAKQTPKKRDKA